MHACVFVYRCHRRGSCSVATRSKVKKNKNKNNPNPFARPLPLPASLPSPSVLRYADLYLFEQLDRDGDGKISLDEFMVALSIERRVRLLFSKSVEAMMRDVDQNADGTVSRKELAVAMQVRELRFFGLVGSFSVLFS